MKLVSFVSLVALFVSSLSVLAQGDVETSLEDELVFGADAIQVLGENSEQGDMQTLSSDPETNTILDPESEILADSQNEMSPGQTFGQEEQISTFDDSLAESGEDGTQSHDSSDVLAVVSGNESSDNIAEEESESISDDFSLQDDEIVVSQDYSLPQNNGNTISGTLSILLSDTEQRTILAQSQTITIVRK